MNQCSFRRSIRYYSIFLDLVPSIDKTKGLKSSGYYDGYKDLSWCALVDGSVTQTRILHFSNNFRANKTFLLLVKITVSKVNDLI